MPSTAVPPSAVGRVHTSGGVEAAPARGGAISRPVISAWSAVSPLGLTSSEFAAGLRAGRSATTPLDPERWPGPAGEACLVPGFEIVPLLGRKGTRSMDRVTALAVTAVGGLLRDANGDRLAGAGEDTGLVLGTSTGSAQSIMDFTRDSFVGEKPYFVDPARFPNTVLNCAAGQCAIWHGLRGPNTTIAGGRASGLLALKYTLRLQKAGSAGTVLCGAVEEFSPARAWLEWHSRREDEAGTPLGEGCALVLSEPAEVADRHGRRALAEVLAVETGVYHGDVHTGDDGVHAAVARCVRRALAASRVRPEDVRLVSPSQAPGTRGLAEEAALAEVFAAAEPVRVRCGELLGDTYAASAAFQLAAVVAWGDGDRGIPGGVALISSVDRDGVVACAVLRLDPDTSPGWSGPGTPQTGPDLPTPDLPTPDLHTTGT